MKLTRAAIAVAVYLALATLVSVKGQHCITAAELLLLLLNRSLWGAGTNHQAAAVLNVISSILSDRHGKETDPNLVQI